MNTNNKPVVKCEDALIFDLFGKKRMECKPLNYPEDHMVRSGCVENNQYAITSEVVSFGSDFVETKRTYYHVLSWRT